jgi:hypothetical protein
MRERRIPLAFETTLYLQNAQSALSGSTTEVDPLRTLDRPRLLDPLIADGADLRSRSSLRFRTEKTREMTTEELVVFVRTITRPIKVRAGTTSSA